MEPLLFLLLGAAVFGAGYGLGRRHTPVRVVEVPVILDIRVRQVSDEGADWWKEGGRPPGEGP